MFLHSKKVIFLLIFIILTALYFFYFFKIFIPEKSVTVGNFFTKNESSRHILKVAILNEKSFRTFLESLNKSDEDIFNDALDLILAAIGFTHSPAFNDISLSKQLKYLVSQNITFMEKYELSIKTDDLNIMIKNVDLINELVHEIEIIKYNSFLDGLIKREEKTLVIMISIIYLSISILILIVLLLYTLYRNKNLEADNLNQQKILLTQSKIAALGDVIVNIAHQWRQPLSIITTSVSSLKLYIELGEEPSSKTIIKCSDDVMTQAMYLSKTIDDLREFINEDSLNSSAHYLKDIFKKLNNLTKDVFLKESIQLITKIDENEIVSLNDNILIQSLLNICYNVQDAFVKSDVSNENRYLFITVYKENNKLIFLFKDSAGGISEEFIHKVFDPYFTTKDDSLGSGIGLFRTKQIITKHLKGSIEVKNSSYRYLEKDLKGAEFTIILENK